MVFCPVVWAFWMVFRIYGWLLRCCWVFWLISRVIYLVVLGCSVC